MDAKIFILVICALHHANSAGLLRTPKVYNALITTDENLTPSRAFPLIQPTIHETGIAAFPFGFPAYRFVNPPPRSPFGPFGFGEAPFRPPQPYGAFPKEQFPLEPPQNQLPENLPPPSHLPPLNQTPPRAPEGEIRPPFPLPHPTHHHQQQPPIPPEAGRPPIPLNEFGLPPSLVPLPSLHRPQNPVNLQPYPFNNYPLIYDQVNQFVDHYLPPFGYYPQQSGFGIAPPNKDNRPASRPNQPQPDAPRQEEPKAPETLPENAESSNPTPSPDSLKVRPNVEGIKNVSVSRNIDVPDVPPPPIPSGAKVTA